MIKVFRAAIRFAPGMIQVFRAAIRITPGMNLCFLGDWGCGGGMGCYSLGMTNKPKHQNPVSPRPVTPAPLPPPPSHKKSFESFLPAARQLGKEQVQPLKLDVNLIYANVGQGVSAVLPLLPRLVAELPMLPVDELTKLPALAEALLYAHAESQRHSQPGKRQEIDAKLTELLALREPLLLQAEVFAHLGLVPADRVAQIRAGKGLFDAAQDGVALSDLYGEYRDRVAGKHPFTEAQLSRVAELGQGLLQVITPDGARTPVTSAAAQAMEDRDRIYSLLLLRHAALRKAGFYLFGEQVDELVPALGARLGKRRDLDAPEPAPVAPSPSSP